MSVTVKNKSLGSAGALGETMDRSEFDDSVTGTPFEVKPMVPDYSTPGSGQNDDLVFPESVQVNSFRPFCYYLGPFSPTDD